MANICPDNNCSARLHSRPNQDACFSCGHDTANLAKEKACKNAILLLEDKLDSADILIEKLYASGCLDMERELLVKEWMEI